MIKILVALSVIASAATAQVDLSTFVSVTLIRSGMMRAVIRTGSTTGEIIVSDNPTNSDRQRISQWVSAGGVITIEPQPTPSQADVSRRSVLFDQYVLIVTELAGVDRAIQIHPSGVGSSRLTGRRAVLLARESSLWLEITAP